MDMMILTSSTVKATLFFLGDFLDGILITEFLKAETASKSRFCAYAENEYKAESRWFFVDAEQFLSFSSQFRKSEIMSAVRLWNVILSASIPFIEYMKVINSIKVVLYDNTVFGLSPLLS